MKKWWLNILKVKRVFRRKRSMAKPVDWPFFPLTPTRTATRISTYWQAMDFALSKKDIRNIAITGSYGAGKSSFLRTYFDEAKNVLWISLASFLGNSGESDDLEDPDGGSHEGDGEEPEADQSGSGDKAIGGDIFGAERRLELSILQQIFYKFTDRAVPYSRLRKTTNVPICWYRERLLGLVLVVVAVLGVWQPNFILSHITGGAREVADDCLNSIFWTSAVALLGMATMVALQVLRWIKIGGLKKIEVGGLEIEMSKKTDRSVLNQNIDEIIYHFESSDYRIVIFEDIDRFNDIDIFTKLREVNLLLNNAEQIKGKPIRFIYALREELFAENEDKVKFFDFVIPIVPVINASNSRLLLHKFLENKCKIKIEGTRFGRMIKDIAHYISDMRLLKNICNEFYAYQKQIPDCPSKEELFGMVVFKNFFPVEFALMHQEDGAIKALLNEKIVAQQALLDGLDVEIAKLKDGIEKIKAERMVSLKDLKDLYYAELMRNVAGEELIRFADRNVRTDMIIKSDDWLEVLRSGKMVTRYGGVTISWDQIEQSVDPSSSYDERAQRIDGKVNGAIEEKKNEIQKLRAKKETVRSKSIVELMAEGALKESDIKSKVLKAYDSWQDVELFMTLIRNGYLNERYYYYISMFYEVEGANSRTDYYFKMEVLKGAECDWKSGIERPQEVVEDIDLHYFSTMAILNFAICKELLRCPESEKAKSFWRLLTHGDRKCYEFVDAYLKSLDDWRDADAFFDCLMVANPDYISELVVRLDDEVFWPRELTERQVGLYIAWALRQGRGTVIRGFVRTFVEESERLPDLLKKNGICTSEEMVAFVKMFGLRFKRLDCKAAKAMGLLDVVIAERAYAIEPDIIKGVLVGDGVDVAGFETKNYSVISRHKPVVAYVDAEFKTYLDAVYLKCEARQEDDLERVLNVINRENLSMEDKQKFIRHQWRKGRVDDVKKIKSDEMVRMCIKEDWIVPTWGNAVEVWNRNKDELEPFRVFVNREECYTALSAKGTRGIAWEKDEWWANSFAEDKKLSDDAVAGLLSGMADGELTSYTGKNATPARIRYLVEHNRVKYSNELYRSLKSIGNDSHIVLAVECAKEFCDEYEGGLVGEDDAKKILLPDRLVRRYAVRVINTLKDLIVDSGDLIDEVVRFINKGNYTEFDECVLDAALDSITPVSLQCRIIQHLGGDADEIRRQLGRLEEPYKKLAGLGSRQQISRWDGVEGFLNFLKEKGVVSTTGEGDGGKIQVNTTRS